MEDISRELEKEITQLKPSPYKKSTRKKILVIDDFGEIKSAGYLKVFLYIFLFISVISSFAASGLYYLFSSQSLENILLKSKLTGLEDKVGQLLDEKEVLMARLVISGKKPGLEPEAGSDAVAKTSLPKTAAKGKKPGIKGKHETVSSDIASINSAATRAEVTRAEVKSKDVVQKKVAPEPEAGMDGVLENKTTALDPAVLKAAKPVQQIVAIEKFSVTRNGGKGDLLVRFDIRNITEKPGGVSGRIFIILQPADRPENEWLVVPAVPLKKGVPTQYRKGQYFSIAHFKPVKFRIENQAGPDFFKKAAIYIFNEGGDLMFESLIDITEAESS